MQKVIACFIILIINFILGTLLLQTNKHKILSLALNPFKFIRMIKFYLLITNFFVHSSLEHLIFNMLTFYFFAFQLERTIGSIHLGIIYFICGIISSIPSIIRFRNDPSYFSLGASGAISGIVFSYIYFYPTSTIYIFFIPIGIPATIFSILFLIYCMYAAKCSKDIVNHEAHFWGAVTGIIMSIILFPQQIEYLKKIFLLIL